MINPPFRYVEDLTWRAIDADWYLLEAPAAGRYYLYNRSSCEIASLPAADRTGAAQIARRVCVSRPPTEAPQSSGDERTAHARTPRLMLFPTASCNFRCAYCHCQSGGKAAAMRPDVAVDLVSRYVSYLRGRTDGLERVDITFMGGGEPLLAFPTIRAVVDHVGQAGLDGRYSVVTNGSVGTARDWLWMLSKGFKITLSLDGPPDIQDQQRMFYRGQRRTSTALESRLRFLSDSGASVAVRSTVLESSAEQIDAICTYVYTFPCVNTHHLEPLSPAGRAANAKNTNEAFYSSFFRHYSRYLYHDPQRFKSAWFRPYRKREGFCGAVHYNAIVTHDGFVSLCPEIDSSARGTSYGRRFLVAHIEDQEPFVSPGAVDFAEERHTSRLPHCMDCIIRHKCGGGCYVKRERDYRCDDDFYKAYCASAIRLNMSYIIGRYDARYAE